MSVTQCWTITQHLARRLLHSARHLRRHGAGHAAGHAVPRSPATIVRLVCRKLLDALGPAGKAALVGGAAMTFPPGAATPPPAPASLERGAPAKPANAASVLTRDDLMPPSRIPVPPAC